MFKGGDKEPLLKDNYRWVTLLTTFRKVYESVLENLFKDDILDKISGIQGAPRKGCLSLETSFLLQEIVQHREG